MGLDGDGLVSTYQFKAGSIYDPNKTNSTPAAGTNHQPYGHDQWALLYRTYRVIGSKITVKWLHNGQLPLPVYCGVVNDEASDISFSTGHGDGLNILRERTGGAGMAILPKNTNRMVTTRAYFSAKKQFEVDNATDAHQGRVAFGSAPSYDSDYTLYAGYMNATATQSAAELIAQVDIEYLCEFYDPITQSAS